MTTSVTISVNDTTLVVLASGSKIVSLFPANSQVVIGGSDVDSVNGFPLSNSLPFQTVIGSGDTIYGLSLSGNVDVHVLRTPV